MTTKREQVLAALFVKLKTVFGPTVDRNLVLPVKIPSEGLIIMRDGKPGEPDVLLSPLTYVYDHLVDVEVISQSGSDREAALDALLTSIGTVLTADRTLGGLCDWAEAVAPEPTDFIVEGGIPIRAVILPIRLTYSTTDPLA